jgi:hypothetical protein
MKSMNHEMKPADEDPAGEREKEREANHAE